MIIRYDEDQLCGPDINAIEKNDQIIRFKAKNRKIYFQFSKHVMKESSNMEFYVCKERI